jgi:tetratricopeptide (TPR) repeat protein
MPTTRILACVLLAVSSLFAGPAAAQQATPAPDESGRAVTSPGNARWAPDAEAARARAAADQPLIYYEFVSQGCGDCRRMQALLYPAFDFEALLIGMVPVQLELASPDGARLAERYGITAAPAVLITTSAGRLVFLVQGFRSAPDFYSHVHKDLDTYRKFARTVDDQDVGKLSAEEAYTTGKELYRRYDFAAAAARLERASTAPAGSADLREKALEGLASAELELERPARARKAIDRLLAMTKNPERKQTAELFQAQIALAEQDPGHALAIYKKFEKDYPKSPYLEKVRSYIARLEAAAPKS